MIKKAKYRLKVLANELRITLLKYKFKNISIGNNTVIQHGSIIDIRNNTLRVGNNVLLRSNPRGYHASMPFPCSILIDGVEAKCSIGDNSRINGAYIHAMKNIEIGKNCVIASSTNIIDSNGHKVNSLNRTKGRDLPEDIIIGNNVWIGLNSIILKGTNIGDNSIVSAGSVVKGDFPPDSIIQGNPGRVIKKIELNDRHT